MAHETSGQSTYQITVSPVRPGSRRLAEAVAKALVDFGANITYGVGVWDGEIEQSATITFHGPRPKFLDLMAGLARFNPGWNLAHVERIGTHYGTVERDVIFYDLNVHR